MAESVAERIRREQAAAVRVFDRVFAERVATISKHNAQQIKELRAQVAALRRLLLSETHLESGDYTFWPRRRFSKQHARTRGAIPMPSHRLSRCCPRSTAHT